MANETNNTTDKVVDNQYFVYDGSNDYIEKENEEYLAEGKGSSDVEIVVSGDPNETSSDALLNKYKEMADMRRDYEDIDIKDCIPTLDEMIQDDMMYEILEKAANGNTEKDVLSAAYYVDEPRSKELGYNSELNVFIYKVNSLNIDPNDVELNKIDGDTFRVPLHSIIESGDPTINMNNGESYSNFKDYCYRNGLVNQDLPADKQYVQIRLIGVDCPEIPHLEVQMMKETDIVSMSLSDARNKKAIMLKYKYNGTSALERNDSNKIDFYKVKNSSGGYSYHEIIKSGSKFVKNKKSGYVYKVIVTVDDSEKDTLVAGYKAQKNLVDLLSSGNVYFMLDANGIKANKTASKYNLYYNHWWNAADAVKNMIEQWIDYTDETGIARLSYAPYGTDGYGRFIGAAYAPKDGELVNIAKYNIADSETKSVANPDFSSSSELGNLGGDNAAAFELHNYNKNNQIWLDSFSEMTKESYKARLEFHKEITGIDFTKVRNCTMMIGDTFLLIPPQNIRSLSSIDYEKVSIMRGKGSMLKNNTNRDMFLEVDLYFYNDAGINGIPKDVILPGGQEMTYFVNGLRSIIAQFKVAPYLPIENQFINDVLNIEAVSLVNLSISTVEGIPRLLRATLTMREFNYRIYMPDIPIDYSSNQMSDITEMNPIFAKCFNWEVFRYYYQRMISAGAKVKDYEYNSPEYKREVYSRKEALQPVYFCEKDGFGASDISFYTPDENWLKAALSIKKDKMFYGQEVITVQLTKNGEDFLNKAGKIKELKINEKYAKRIANNCEILPTKTTFGETIKNEDIFDQKEFANKSIIKKDEDGNLYNLIMDVVSKVESCGVLTYVSTDEEYNINDREITWKIYFRIPADLNSEDIQSIREKLRDLTGLPFNSVLTSNKLTVSIVAKVENKKVNPDMTISCREIEAMNNFKDGVEKTADVGDVYNYLEPAAMQFLPYLEDVEVHSLSFSLTNNFSDITLKIMDGFAPQYMGSSDITIDVNIITTNVNVVSMLNVLPAHAANIGKLYRRILSCWPIKVRNHYLQMAGVNEVLIDLVEVQTMEGFPGTYEIRLRMTSVDRTMRQRETLKQLQSDEKSTAKAAASMYSYWDLENVLASAELYPDLDLPSIKELNEYGFQFIKYKKTKQAYPDPDFYLNYSWPYTSYIIKKNLKDVFYNKIFHDEGKEKSELLDDTSYEFFDHMGMTLYKKLDPVIALDASTNADGKTQNDRADTFDEAMKVIDEGAAENIKKAEKSEAREREEKDCSNLANSLIYLTACDVQQGWTLKPGFTAPVVVQDLNQDIEKLYCSGIEHEEATVDEMHNAYAEDVFNLRAEAITAIDEYLSKPIDYSKFNYNISTYNPLNSADGYGGLMTKVVEKFVEDETAKKILQLLNPFEESWFVQELGEWEKLFDGQENYTGQPDYDEVYMLNYLAGFLYSAAKCISAEKLYDDDTKETLWEPRQYAIDGKGEIRKDSEGNKIPNCKIEINGKPLRQAETLQEALDQGTKWGMFQIKIYKSAELQKMLQPRSRVTYLSKDKMPMYKDPKTGKERWHAGFIDPYYNIVGYKSKEGKEYIRQIATNEGVNTIAFIRVMLMHLRRMIIDGEIFSEIDVIAKDYDEIKKTIKIEPTGKDFNEGAERSSETMYDNGGVFGLIGLMAEEGIVEGFKDYFTFGELNKNTQVAAIEDAVVDEDMAGQLLELIETVPKSYKRSFCARLALPTLMAVTENDGIFDSMLVNYRLSELNNMTVGAVINVGDSLSMIGKFCKAMNTTGMLEFASAKTDPETTSDSQKLWNYIMREAYTKLANDPQAYTLHSYYDMLINDKRGRLIRAFPTYYVVFVDEGRKIGSWKLFDNFYNMSAISEITVSKSRKLPADTCSFVMSNIYTSYAATYDNTTRQQYVDIYGLRDVFNSIFCPESYFIKEDALRRRKESTETVVLQPGVRIHVRMGYGADASRLPIVFNGKIAEVDVSEVVQVIAQGDGIELVNPLNTLGEIDAVELTEAQSWTTMFKDIRGSLKRGGESPRNLLGKLLTAKYGGVFKTVAREMFADRFYADNPFGIYHFGDNRFNGIFAEGETVQNLYEVCDATLLKGSNELYSSRENTMATPTINTTIQDKTFWDLLQLCANSGVGYMGAVRDFGMRSTVCLCKPNHYYAFGYKKIDDEDGQTEGKTVERRKPFQQFHYYNSYTDIVYNSIKASEKNMKTNAVGIWESTDMIWGKSQSTVGPIYLDMNIYPEHQKSMTVDTTLISDGAGGLELNIFTHFSENWASDANDNKVNKALAERVTTNVLRESVSNMYCGELCVLGDTSIKPFDRFYVEDTYEDMQGHMEVEGVVYSMNSATGFTTTIYPDTIVRMGEDNHEAAVHLINGRMLGSLSVAVTGRLLGINTLARMDTVLLRVLQRGAALLSTPADEMAAGVLGKFFVGSKFTTAKEAAVAAIEAGMSTVSIATTIAIAVGIYICANNVKSYFGSFLKNINALSVYPIYKNQRPLIAGMAGHKGSVRGYEYTEQDTKDSIQGLIHNCVEWMNGDGKFLGILPFNLGDCLMGMFTRKVQDENGNKISEYEFVKQQWAKTLPLDGTSDPTQPDSEGKMSTEEFMQLLYGSATNEFAGRSQMIQQLRVKWRIPSLIVSKESGDMLADNVYKSYHIEGITSVNEIATNDKILGLYPIEDELEIKQATIKGSHPNIKQLEIAHSTGNMKVQIPFESGNRIIKLFTEIGNDSSYVYDLPMLQQDAIMILKLIINDQALKNKKVAFLSGARINDQRTWKSTGFAFILDSPDRSALMNALKQVQEQTTSLTKEKTQIFEYKESDNGVLIIVYAPIPTGTTAGPVEEEK